MDTDAFLICMVSPTVMEFACWFQRQSLTFPVSSAIQALVTMALFPYRVWTSEGFGVSRTSASTLTFFIPCRRSWIMVERWGPQFCLAMCLRILSVFIQVSKQLSFVRRSSSLTRNCTMTLLCFVIRNMASLSMLPRYWTVRSMQADFPFSLAETSAWKSSARYTLCCTERNARCSVIVGVFWFKYSSFHFLFARTVLKKAKSLRSRFASFLKNPDNQISSAMLTI